MKRFFNKFSIPGILFFICLIIGIIAITNISNTIMLIGIVMIIAIIFATSCYIFCNREQNRE